MERLDLRGGLVRHLALFFLGDHHLWPNFAPQPGRQFTSSFWPYSSLSSARGWPTLHRAEISRCLSLTCLAKFFIFYFLPICLNPPFGYFQVTRTIKKKSYEQYASPLCLCLANIHARKSSSEATHSVSRRKGAAPPADRHTSSAPPPSLPRRPGL